MKAKDIILSLREAVIRPDVDKFAAALDVYYQQHPRDFVEAADQEQPFRGLGVHVLPSTHWVWKQTSGKAAYDPAKHLVILKLPGPGQPWDDYRETILSSYQHEAVHQEQHRRTGYKWYPKPATNRQDYYRRPWEQMAYAGQNAARTQAISQHLSKERPDATPADLLKQVGGDFHTQLHYSKRTDPKSRRRFLKYTHQYLNP